MVANIATVEDLQQLREALLKDIQTMLTQSQAPAAGKKWLKSHQVMRLLTLSPGTLQHLRLNGTLPYSKVGGVIFYDPKDIEQMLQQRKQNALSNDVSDNDKTTTETGR